MNSHNEAINTNYYIHCLYHRYIYTSEREACDKQPIVECIRNAVKNTHTHTQIYIYIYISDNSKSDLNNNSYNENEYRCR